MFTHPALRCVVCNSDMVRQEIVRHYGVDPARLVVIRNGLDLQRFRPPTPQEHQEARARLGWPDDRAVFLFVGSGFERKGVAAALRAMAHGALRHQALLVLPGPRLGRFPPRAGRRSFIRLRAQSSRATRTSSGFTWGRSSGAVERGDLSGSRSLGL